MESLQSPSNSLSFPNKPGGIWEAEAEPLLCHRRRSHREGTEDMHHAVPHAAFLLPHLLAQGLALGLLSPFPLKHGAAEKKKQPCCLILLSVQPRPCWQRRAAALLSPASWAGSFCAGLRSWQRQNTFRQGSDGAKTFLCCSRNADSNNQHP